MLVMMVMVVMIIIMSMRWREQASDACDLVSMLIDDVDHDEDWEDEK